MIDHKTVRADLIEKIAALEGRASRLEAHQHREGRDIPTDWDDRLNYTENDGLVDTLDEHTRREIAMLKAAVHRIDDGSWGECSSCEKPISENRLRALPTATICIACASAIESRAH
jgi:DnaK suppressor protein